MILRGMLQGDVKCDVTGDVTGGCYRVILQGDEMGMLHVHVGVN